MTDENRTVETEEMPPELATQVNRGRRYLALSLMTVAALFSGIVIGVMVMTWLEDTGTGYPESALLKSLQVLSDKDPGNEALKEVYRKEDLRIRALHDVRRERMQVGGVLLVAGVLVIVVCARWYVSLDSRLPGARKAGEVQEEPGLSPRARGAIAVAIVGLALVGTLIGMSIDWTPTAPVEPDSFKDNWPGFRGPTGMGVAPAGTWPLKWNAASGENILWKTEVPLSGKSSPVMWGRRIFLTAADAKTQKVLCYDRKDGRLMWEATVLSPESMTRIARGPAGELNVAQDTGYAAPTPVTDGKHLYAVFASADVAAVDFNGRVVWVRNLGTPDSAYGLSSSLAFHKGTVIFQFDQGMSGEDGKSALLGLDAAGGATVWRTERPVGGSWSSPVVARTNEGPVILTCGNPWVIAYDADTGSELWRCEGLSGDVAPSPVLADGKVFVTNDGAQVMCIRTGGEGDVTKTHVAWTSYESTSDASSPLCDGKFYLQATGGAGEVTCFNAADGKLLWRQGFDGGFWASSTLAGDVVYVPGGEGKVELIRFSDKYEFIAENEMGEAVYATPAFGDSQVYIRGDKHLFCIGSK